MVDEAITRIQNAMDPKAAPVRVITRQDVADSQHRRLTADQANALMDTPGVATLGGLRDTAVVALSLCTGMREAELSALQVGDLRQRLGGKLRRKYLGVPENLTRDRLRTAAFELSQRELL